MSLWPDRVLIAFYGVGLLVGLREFLVTPDAGSSGLQGGCEASAASCFAVESRAAPASDASFWRRHAELTELVARLNPDDPDTDFLRAMQAFSEGDAEEFERRAERALSGGAKHNAILQQYHAQYLLDAGAEWRRVNAAVNRWRGNHSFSSERLSLRLSSGPDDTAAATLLTREMERVAWIETAALEPPSGADASWRVSLSIRPGVAVDVRDAVAVATFTSLSPEERRLYTVRCSTLQDCEATRRPGR